MSAAFGLGCAARKGLAGATGQWRSEPGRQGERAGGRAGRSACSAAQCCAAPCTHNDDHDVLLCKPVQPRDELRGQQVALPAKQPARPPAAPARGEAARGQHARQPHSRSCQRAMEEAAQHRASQRAQSPRRQALAHWTAPPCPAPPRPARLCTSAGPRPRRAPPRRAAPRPRPAHQESMITTAGLVWLASTQSSAGPTAPGSKLFRQVSRIRTAGSAEGRGAASSRDGRVGGPPRVCRRHRKHCKTPCAGSARPGRLRSPG